MTKINIFSSFLGAGKTTLIQKLISDGFKDKICLIKNEFGEIAIDGGFMKNAGVEIKEINSGCICCSLVGDFEESLKQVMETYHPERIIIEPSGVGKLSDVKKAVAKVCNENVVIEGSIAVVHAKKCKMYARNYGEFFTDQIAHADCIVLSRSQDANEKKLAETIEIIRSFNEKAPIVTTPWDEISGEQILDALSHSELLSVEAEEHEHHHHDHEHHHHDGECTDPECSCHHDHDHDHHHHHHADDVFTSWGMETTRKFSADELKEIMQDLVNADEYGVILRAKGIVRSVNDGEWLHFNYVPGESSVECGAADYTGRFCVIGSKLHEDSLKELFLGE